MRDYARIRYRCEKSSSFSERLIDNLLVPLCAREKGLGRDFVSKLREYQHIADIMPEGWVPSVTEQYIAFQLFRDGGLAHSYMNHLRIKQRNSREQDYLRLQLDHPWQFTFCRIVEELGDSFFRMEDVITGKEFLLYSPGVDMYEEGGRVSMYFVLMGYNGECWQTYGPIAYFKGIQPFDVFFLAKQIHPSLARWDEISKIIEEDPLPFMALWVGAELPVTYHKSDMLMISHSEFELENLDLEQWNKDFIIEEQKGVYELSLKRWRRHPHFCHCYYSQQEQKLVITSFTERGYAKLIGTLERLGYSFPTEPQIRVTPTGLHAINEVLAKDIEINPYEKLFKVEVSPEHRAATAKMNKFLEILIPALNSGSDYDIRKLADEAGIEYETAVQIAAQVFELTEKIRK